MSTQNKYQMTAGEMVRKYGEKQSRNIIIDDMRTTLNKLPERERMEIVAELAAKHNIPLKPKHEE